MNKHRVPTMLGEKSKDAYQDLVSFLRYKYNTTRLDHLLSDLFKEILVIEKQKCVSSSRVQKKYGKLELLELKVISLLNDNWNIDEWTNKHRESIKISKPKVDTIIKDVYNVHGINKISQLRSTILLKINFKLYRKGSHDFFIVHDNFIEDNKQMKKYNDQISKFNFILRFIKAKGKIAVTDFIELVGTDRGLVLMLNRSKKLYQNKQYVGYVNETK